MKPNFIVVDDESTNNLISRIIIRHVFSDAVVKEFTDPRLALDYIATEYSEHNAPETILFLDINMPIISGWEFLKLFDKLERTVKKSLKIYILTSSVDDRDKEQAMLDKNVADYLEKPLTREDVENVLSRHL